MGNGGKWGARFGWGGWDLAFGELGGGGAARQDSVHTRAHVDKMCNVPVKVFWDFSRFALILRPESARLCSSDMDSRDSNGIDWTLGALFWPWVVAQ